MVFAVDSNMAPGVARPQRSQQSWRVGRRRDSVSMEEVFRGALDRLTRRVLPRDLVRRSSAILFHTPMNCSPTHPLPLLLVSCCGRLWPQLMPQPRCADHS